MQTVRVMLKFKGAHVYSVSPLESVFVAIRFMAEKEIGALLVMQEGHPVGIVSERDYTRKVILRDRASKHTRVSEIMTCDLITVGLDDHMDHCVALMREHHTRHLPVMEEGRMLGVLSLRDLFSAIIDEQQHTIEHLEHYVRGQV
ncbi:MAG: CBS domain-containing protein [Pseudomonadales bacterium]|jgi:CBS domain-containing protein|nr:CBS domain-containing protein [Pseudomonadales bacterium]MDP6471852.1 CBS domain-containing protein [Pseudomonadales bacterium]MDP6826878.1 CBS domain-containing protein [Pseudomonadales bacterium]MDP6970844.1 CBS domain-containing protein [Pseudomonadales bacterium]|tara:strand:+ start:1369 stop:1803 length:435 start_codon:yes stop_codon:yes gene_type:complete